MHIQHLVKQYLTMIKWLNVTMQELYDDCSALYYFNYLPT